MPKAAKRSGLTQALGAQIVDKAQFRQTIIGTGVVGAVFGAMPVLALLFSAFTHGLGSEPSRSLLAMSLDLGLIFFGCIAFCILCFGLVPMALQHGFVYIVRRWTGRA